MTKLTEKKCLPCEGDTPTLTKQEAEKLLSQTPGWTLNHDATAISRSFEFKGFYKTMSFVNAVAWIANQENHHPDLDVSYGYCKVKYHTHAINGLSENDFICAAKINELIRQE